MKPTIASRNPSLQRSDANPSWLAPEAGYGRLMELPESLQETLMEHLRVRNLTDAHALLQSVGFDTSELALARFQGHWSAACLHARLRGWDDALAQRLASDPRGLAPELDLQFGQRLFSAQSLEEGSAAGWAAVQKIRLQRDKDQFDAARACLDHLEQLRAIQNDGALDDSARIRAVREALFGVVPEI